MEVVEFEPDQAFGMVIHDGPMEMRGRVLFETVNDNQTRLTTIIEFPGMEEPMDKTFLLNELEKAGRIRKELIETEVE